MWTHNTSIYLTVRRTGNARGNSAELPLRAGLICTTWTYHASIKAVHMSPAPSRSSALQCFKRDKYGTEKCFISTWDCHTCRKIQPQGCVCVCKYTIVTPIIYKLRRKLVSLQLVRLKTSLIPTLSCTGTC